MPRDGSARIVNVGSRGAFRGEPNSPAYGASKAGIAAFGQSLARALVRGDLRDDGRPGLRRDRHGRRVARRRGRRRARAESPFDRVARPEEVADAVVYLASAQAQWASGAILDLNGASYLR